MIQTGFESRVKVQQVIESQLPNFILDESPNTAEFLKQYYISQEYQGGPTDISENIDKYINLENFEEQNYLNGETKLNGAITYYDDVITVDSTESWPSEYGLLKIGDEIITYTGKTSTTFIGCIRGFSGIESLHKTNNPEFLVFSSSLASEHADDSTVVNLSNIFLREFWKHLKYQFLPGFENRELVSGLDQAFFLSRAKDFYASKGTDEAIKILFKVIFGETPSIINLEDYLIKPSSANYVRREVAIAEVISGEIGPTNSADNHLRINGNGTNNIVLDAGLGVISLVSSTSMTKPLSITTSGECLRTIGNHSFCSNGIFCSSKD